MGTAPLFELASSSLPAASTPDRVAVEARWIVGVRAGDHAAFDEMFRATAADLCDFAYSYVHSSAVAEELVQDVFFRIWQGRRQWQLRGSLRTYLYSATRNASLNYLRHERVERRWVERMSRERTLRSEVVRSSVAGIDDIVVTEELAIAAARAVEQLPERCQLIYRLTRQHHLSYAEVADMLKISVRTVENQVGIALKTLRKRLAHLLMVHTDSGKT
jgi:RNA polymerase sigma-70 factor (ECF subfamily)